MLIVAEEYKMSLDVLAQGNCVRAFLRIFAESNLIIQL